MLLLQVVCLCGLEMPTRVAMPARQALSQLRGFPRQLYLRLNTINNARVVFIDI